MNANASIAQKLFLVLILSTFSFAGASAQGDLCDDPPSSIDGTFDGCTEVYDPNCPTILFTPACQWIISHGAPELIEYAPNDKSMALYARDDGAQGMFTCFEFKANTTYKISYQIRNWGGNAAQIVVKAANGLDIRSNFVCRDAAPTPSSDFLIDSRIFNNTAFETITVCFTTDNSTYNQLWIQSVYPSSGNPDYEERFEIDNIEFADDVDFRLGVNASSVNPVTICQSSLTVDPKPGVFLQMISEGLSCIVGNYEVCLTGEGLEGSRHELSADELEDLISGKLDLNKIFPLDFVGDKDGKCYTITVKSLADENPTESEIEVCLVLDCECDFSKFEILPFMGLDGETIFPIEISGGYTNIAAVHWKMGDGTTSTEITPEKVYPVNTGKYNVCATIYAVHALTGECCEEEICIEIDTDE